MRSYRFEFVTLAVLLALSGSTLVHGQKKATPAPAKAAAAPKAATSAAHPTTAATHPGATATAGHGAPGAAGHSGTPGGMNHGPAGGNMSHARGGEISHGPHGESTFHGSHGEEAHFDRGGHVREIHSGNMRIEHGPGGARRVEMERADHSRLVMDGRGRGYVQRPFAYHGRAYDRRAYYYHGRAYDRYYHPYYYHGVYLHGYVPGVYYAPAFYGWAYSPWARPYPYAWGFATAPWYGYYGGYFAPYPVYPAPAFWLTDYVISQQLQASYEAGVAAGAAGATAQIARPSSRPHLVYASYSPYSSGQPAYAGEPAAAGAAQLTPAIKALIAAEVQAYIQSEQGAAQAGGDDSKAGGLEQLLGDGKQHVFVASAGITVSPAAGDCGISEGDVIQTSGAPKGDASTIDATVLASRGTDCAANSTVPVKLEDLQEMENSMAANVDQGLGEMKAHPGQGGLPAPPAAALEGQTNAAFTSAAPASDANVGQELQQADQQAQQTEQQVLADAAPTPDAGAGAGAPAPTQATPVTIALGQTTTDVLLNKGKPKQIVNLGPKTIYVYDDFKITFLNGRVSDVQ